MGRRDRIVCVIVVIVAGCIPIDAAIDPRPCPRGEPPPREALTPECDERLATIWRDETGFDAVVIMEGERVVFARGQIDTPSNTASVRKSLLSVLYGVAQARGLVDLDATLEDLGVDDAAQPLTRAERQATVRHLMQARSGVYLPALGAPAFWTARRPERGVERPGARFFYNNWDFNALGSIFAQTTGLSLERALTAWLAEPLGMQTFCPSHVVYEEADFTAHPMYRVYMSAYDLALVGALIAQAGQWQGERVVEASWIEESTRPVSTRGELLAYNEDAFYDGFGHMWWTDTARGYVWGDGFGGQRLLIDRASGLVSVGRNHTGLSDAGFVWSRTGQRADLERVGPEHLLRLHDVAKACAR